VLPLPVLLSLGDWTLKPTPPPNESAVAMLEAEGEGCNVQGSDGMFFFR